MTGRTMKNKYSKSAHISESKFRQLLRLFCIDLEAKQIAEILKINRRTINYYLHKFRIRIYQLAKNESYFSKGEIEVDESYFGAKRVRGIKGRGAKGKTIVFGMKKRGDKVYTQIVENCSAKTLIPIIKSNTTSDSVIYSDEWKSYDGLVNKGYKKHYRVKHSNNQFSNGKAHVNGIENFWGIAKTRLVKFRGLKKEYFKYHLKETEFRFNHKNGNLYKILLDEFRKNPL
jgi:transposase